MIRKHKEMRKLINSTIKKKKIRKTFQLNKIA